VHHVIEDLHVLFQKSLDYLPWRIVKEAVRRARSGTDTAVKAAKYIFLKTKVRLDFFHYSDFFFPRHSLGLLRYGEVVSIRMSIHF